MARMEPAERRASRRAGWDTKRRMLILVSAASFFALSVVLATTSLAKPGKASDGLTPEQREEFIVGAREVAGLSDAEIKAALKDPAARAAIPVSAETVLIDPAAATGAPQGRNSSAAAQRCKTVGGQVNYKNASGQVLAYFQSLKYWCWDFYTVTYAPPASAKGVVTSVGAGYGWRYKGLLRAENSFFTYAGRSRGGHVSKRTGSFQVCTNATNCIQKAPKVNVFTYYNGNGYSVTRQ